MRRILWTFLVSCVTASVGELSAQTPAPNGQSPQLVPRTPQQREQTYAAHHRINMHVVVTDASGKTIMGLRPEDFTILDQQRSEKIAKFEEISGSRVAHAYVHGMVVLDAINGGKWQVNRVHKELVRLLGQSDEPLTYPLEIVVVSEAGRLESKPTTDRRVLIEDLSDLTRNVQSTDCNASQPGDWAQLRWNCLNTHFTESLNALKSVAEEQQNVNGRAIVIWTGSGWPLPPQVETGQTTGGGIKGDLSDALFSLEADMEQGQVTLEAVSWGTFECAHGIRRTGMQGALAGATVAEQEAALELPVLAKQTGGLALEKSKNFADALNICLADGEQYYSIAFDSAPVRAQDEYRSIEVKVDRPDATVRTLAGYYAQP